MNPLPAFASKLKVPEKIEENSFYSPYDFPALLMEEKLVFPSTTI
jgi:hypothetical protein